MIPCKNSENVMNNRVTSQSKSLDHEFVPATEELLPEWMKKAFKNLLKKYPYDEFEICMKRGRIGDEFKMKCNDCQGKLYQSGAGQSFSNFEIHLRNRTHRVAVESRLDLGSYNNAEEEESEESEEEP
jgi:hypothetical protein